MSTAAPAPFLPQAETAHLRRLYERADVILEYGSGGSTELGARAPGNFLMSVESDQDWARELRGAAARTGDAVPCHRASRRCLPDRALGPPRQRSWLAGLSPLSQRDLG